MSGSEILAIVLLFGLPLLLGLLFRQQLQGKRRREQQRVMDGYAREYRQALWRLESAPGDAALRRQVVRLGRAYARAARDAGQEGLFDEVALLNDLMAVDGDAADSDEGATVAEIAERLARLAALRERAAITAEEYAARRRAILDEL